MSNETSATLPTTAELDAEEATLRNEAMTIDPVRPEDAQIKDDTTKATEDKRAASRDDAKSKTTQRPGGDKKPDAAGTDKPGNSSTAAAKGAKPGDAPAATTTEKPGDKPGEKQETPYAKERARLDRTWKEIQAEKDALKKEKEELAAERQRTATASQQRTQQQAAEPPKIKGGTRADWEAVAADFKAQGNLTAYEKAKANADQLAEQEKAQAAQQPAKVGTPAERFTEAERAEMLTKWNAHAERLAAENPDLKVETSPLRTRTAALLQEQPALHLSGDGIAIAVRLAKAEMAAEQGTALNARIAELEKENERLTGLTSLDSGGAAARTTAKKFDELSLADQEAELRRDAAGGS